MKYILPTMGAVAAAALFTFSTVSFPASAKETSKSDTFKQLELFADVMARVRNEYVVDVDDVELIEGALNGMLHNLDPHSSYINPEQFKRLQTTTSGEYGGLGMEVTSESGVVRVVAPIDESPAKEAGIEAGDYITEIDGESIIGVSLSEAVEQMRGKPGEPITITVIRGNEDPLEFDLVRAVIKSRATKYEIKDGVGYLRIPQFNEKTTVTLVDAVAALKKEFDGKIPGMVLDLRGNPGGLLDESITVSSVFLDGGEVVSTRGRKADDVKDYFAKKGQLVKGVPLVVLIDGASASASEIVAGAIQDRDRGLVVGMTSFGKGSVQSVIPLRGGRDGALRMTTQRYYTPSGRSIQGTGITPDIFIAASQEEVNRDRISESDLPNSIQNELANEADKSELDIETPPEGFEEDGDYQLKRAIEILKDGSYTQKLAEANEG
ncbi:MAG: S41 family peptidase [Hellea sp.]|nr:S41 family peptidase [Hellea sp.]